MNSIKKSGDIFFAESSRDWILSGANVHVSMIGFDKGEEKLRCLDGKQVVEIHSNLTALSDVTAARQLRVNKEIAFIGTKKAGDFDVADKLARDWLCAPNPNGKPNSDLLKPWLNGSAIVKRPPSMWVIDAGVNMPLTEFSLYEQPARHVLEKVKPERDKNNRAAYRDKWWIHAEARPGMRKAFANLNRYLVTSRISKHRIFIWADTIILPDDGTFTFARSDDYFFGVLHSRLHEIWSLKLGTRLETRPRYTPNTCFETFPFPRPTPAQEAAIAAAAKELNQNREGWLNPPEWTAEKILEFPGSANGPWSRYIDKSTIREVGRVTPCAPGRTAEDCHPYLVGTVRYPRLEPRDADCAAKLKDRTLTKLYNERPAWLDLAHKKLDAAVAAAYGFPDDLTDEAILENLLALNLDRAAEEAKAAKVKKPKAQRAKEEGELV